MKLHSSSDSFKKILSIVVGTVFIVALAAMTYATINTNMTNRSKASEEDVILKQWEFNGKDTEGWKATNALTFGLKSGGLLDLVVDPKVAQNPLANQVTIYNDTRVQLPSGYLDYIKMSLRIQPLTASGGRVCALGTVGCKITPTPTTSVSPTPITFPITIKVSLLQKAYMVHNNGNGRTWRTVYYKDVSGSPVTMSGIADGQFHTYATPIKNISALASGMNFDRMVITIPELSFRPWTTMDVDWIRITFPKPVTTPTPSRQPAQPITKVGTVQKSNLEGQSRYILVVSKTEQYALVMSEGGNQGDVTHQPGSGSTNTGGSGGPRGSTSNVVVPISAHPTGPEQPPSQILEQYVGKEVQVVGTLYQAETGKIGILTGNLATIFVTSITLVGTTTTTQGPTSTAAPLPPNCHYQQVECFRAPCNPVLVCSTPTPH